MIKRFLLFAVVTIIFASFSFGQNSAGKGGGNSVKGGLPVVLSATGGTLTADYTTLGEALVAINIGTHTGVITITINENTTEIATATLNASGSGSASYTSIMISPDVSTNPVVGGSIAASLVTLNGAKNVTINGLVTGATLTFYNSSTTGNTLTLTADASNNSFNNVTFKGATASLTSGVVAFTAGIVTGDDGNTFQTCNFDGTGIAYTVFYSTGLTTTSATENSNNTLSNCNFYDNYNAATASPVLVFLNSGNTNWSISGNSFYQRANRTTALQGVNTLLQVFPAWTSDEHNIENNFVGGSGPGATGTYTISATSTNVVGFIGMSIQTGGPGNLIQGNTIRNVTVSYASTLGSFGNAGMFLFIGGYDGTTTANNNTITNFTVLNTLGSALGSGLQANGRVTTALTTVKPVFTITNNTISNLSFTTNAAASSSQFYGIRLEASSGTSLTLVTTVSNPNFIVTGNTITNLTSGFAGLSTWIKGIGCLPTNGTSSTCALWPKATISNNTISNFSAASSLANYATGTVAGIHFLGSANFNNTTDLIAISGNSIYNLASTNTADLASSVHGIIGTNGLYSITKNKIYGLLSSSPGTAVTPIVSGINIRASFGNSYIANNYISLGSAQTNNTSLFGVLSNFAATSPINIYNNSIFISGAPSAGTRNTACIYRGTEAFAAAINSTLDIKNNLLINNRVGGTSSNFALASYGTGTWTSNYNTLISGSSSQIGYWNALAYDYSGFVTNSAQDKSSNSLITGVTSDFTTNPSVINPTDLFSDASPTTTGILNIKNTDPACWIVNGKGVAIATVATDFDGNVRSVTAGTPTDIGANEITTSTTPPALVETGSFSNSGTTSYLSFGKTIASILWNNVGTIASRHGYFYPGVTPPGADHGNYSKGYLDLGVDVSASGYDYSITMNYDPAFIGTAPNDANTRLAKRTSGTWDFFSTSTPDNVNYTLVANNLTSFSQFAVTDLNNALPVELVNFSAMVKSNQVSLKWKTATEISNQGFEIEKYAGNWVKVGFVKGSGNSNSPKEYSFTDVPLESGKLKYRLKQIDTDGKYTYSKEIEVDLALPTEFSLNQNYPNPFNPTTTIRFALPVDSKVVIRVYNTLGENVSLIKDELISAGTHEAQFNGSNLPSGIYFIRLNAESINGHQKYSSIKKMTLLK